MKTYRAELHVHTVLSPCAAIEMIPPVIVAKALQQGIDLIAVTDHNASANVAAVMTAAKGTSLTVLPGMELQTQEEIHVLCLFDTVEQLGTFQMEIDARMPRMLNNPEFFGEQYIVDETGEFIRNEDKLLLISCDIGFEEAIRLCQDIEGLAIPAHVNRKAFGLFANLGFLPLDAGIEVVEISRHITLNKALQEYPQLQRVPVIQSGDVHFPDEFLGSTTFNINAPTLSEIRKALLREGGRTYQVNDSPINSPSLLT